MGYYKSKPIKTKKKFSIKKRIIICKKIIGKNKLIKVKYFENETGSNKTTDTIDYLTKNKNYEIYFLIGADNLVNFHKWYKWKNILKKIKLIVFDRHGYKKKNL